MEERVTAFGGVNLTVTGAPTTIYGDPVGLGNYSYSSGDTQFTVAIATPPWPDLSPAPVSDVQTCALAWLKGGDWSAVRPLLDELYNRGRYEDWREIRKAVAMGAAARVFGGAGDYSGGGYYANTLSDSWRAVAARTLWFDLFDLGETLAALEKGA